jgi:subfamily B ATP-binding cassette protein MsbA
VAFVVLLYRLQPHMRAMLLAWSQMQGWSFSLEEVRWLLDSSDNRRRRQATSRPGAHTSRSNFDGVTFKYPGSGEGPVVLHTATFEIRTGCSTAIIIRSGAGKTTIVNLLCRFVEPDQGYILVDGIPLHRTDPTTWRRQIALASQDLELLDGNILENITYGESASIGDAKRAASLAEAHEFIEKLPQGTKRSSATVGPVYRPGSASG